MIDKHGARPLGDASNVERERRELHPVNAVLQTATLSVPSRSLVFLLPFHRAVQARHAEQQPFHVCLDRLVFFLLLLFIRLVRGACSRESFLFRDRHGRVLFCSEMEPVDSDEGSTRLFFF